MSTYYYGPALDSELDYRRGTMIHDAEVDRLAHDARLAARVARTVKRLSARAPAPAGEPVEEHVVRAA
jgi:hypothetical protein